MARTRKGKSKKGKKGLAAHIAGMKKVRKGAKRTKKGGGKRHKK